MKAAELREKAVAELQTQLHDNLKEQFQLRMDKGAGQLAQTHRVRDLRREAARIKTIINEKNKTGEQA